MYLRKTSVWVALGAALFFSLLYLTGWFSRVEDRIYDLFLRLRPRSALFDGVVFLDIDNNAINQAGVFPWPRSIVADGLLRLKEYGVRSVVLDIEYVDASPTQIDELYLKYGLRSDFEGSFAEIASQVSGLLDALGAGRIRREDAAAYSGELSALIERERDKLFGAIQEISRNNDEYFAQAARLLDTAWFTLNIQPRPLNGEQAERRRRIEARFPYPVRVIKGDFASKGMDILAPVPPLLEAARGAGFTNAIVDFDGVRRRILLAQQVDNFWYLQLAFAPLMEYLGNPALEIRPGRLLVKGAVLPGRDGVRRDIAIPLDKQGAMLLNWPTSAYEETFTHVSFAYLTLLEECYAIAGQYLSTLGEVDPALFPLVVEEAFAILGDFEGAALLKTQALVSGSDAVFAEYAAKRNAALEAAELFAGSLGEEEMQKQVRLLIRLYPEETRYIAEEAEYVNTVAGHLAAISARIREIEALLRDACAGKICIVGQTDTGSTDLGVNPFHTQYVNTGTHGVLMDTILSGDFIHPLSHVWSVLLCFVPVPLLLAGMYRFKPGLRILLGFGGAVGTIGGSFALFAATGMFLGPLGPALTITLVVIIHETVAFAGSEREKQFIRKAFSTYVSDDVVREIIADPVRLQLGGAIRHMSAIFTDIQGFSTISEQLEPEALVRLLNRYLTAMSNVLLEQKGTIDKYEGDAIIAFFGAPIEMRDHAMRACTCAIKMKKIERVLNERILAENGSPLPLLTRIGINTGNMVAGNMGTENKMNYTIMGNAVNLAARLEGVNKEYGTWILATEETMKETAGAIVYRNLDRVRVVGIREPVRLCEVLGLSVDTSPVLREKAARFHEALGLYEEGDWSRAGAAFAEMLRLDSGDGPARIFMERCEQYCRKAPGKDWNGVFNMGYK
jgi:adenylate cyclase